MVISQLRQRLEILWQLIERNEGGGSDDSYTKQESDARYVQKVQGKGLSTNDFTDAYKNQIGTNATNIGALDSAIDSLFTPSNITVSESGYLDSTTLDLVELHQPIRLNGKQFYFLAGDTSNADYFAIDNNGNFVAYFARIQLSNGQVLILTSIVGSASPEENGNDLFTTGGAYTLETALETLISYKTDVEDVYGPGIQISNVDLNDYKEDMIGIYWTEDSTESGTLTNCPYTGAAGQLTVQEICIASNNVGPIIQQTWKVNSAGTAQTYIRKWRGSSNGWTQWFRIPIAYDDLQMPLNSFSGSIDLNNYQGANYIGTYRATTGASSNITNQPSSGPFILFVRGLFNTTTFQQEIRYTNEPDKIYIRNYNSGWSSWYVFTGTAVV